MIIPAEEACIVFYGTRIWVSLSEEQKSEAIDKMEEAVDAYEKALERNNVCQVPGCGQQSTCGTPLPDGGYIRTCGDHVAPYRDAWLNQSPVTAA